MAKKQSPAPIFAALGDETRLALVGRLCEGGPASIAELSAGFRMTRQAVTKHLRVLEAAGLVRDTRLGRETIFELRAGRLAIAERRLAELSSRWDEALDRVRKIVED